MTGSELRVGAYHANRSSALDDHATGLVLESTYLWGLFRSRDSEPDIWTALRRLSSGARWPACLLLQTNRGASRIARHQPEVRAARSADAFAAGERAAPVWRARAVDGAEPFEVVVDGESIRWSEGALLELAGSEVAPGLQWCLLANDAHEGMHYRSRMFRVGGSLDGVPVDGFVGCDEVHLAPGRENYVDDPLTSNHLSEAWCTWATAYSDGSIETGHVAFGRDGFGFGLRATDGVAIVTTDVTGTVTHDDRGCPSAIRFAVDGEAWEFVADERGLPAQTLPGPVRQAEGWLRRVGETRSPLVWCATPEVPAP